MVSSVTLFCGDDFLVDVGVNGRILLKYILEE
jgi:hypothetical protein